MTGVIMGIVFLSFGLVRYIYLGIKYRYDSKIFALDASHLTPEREVTFIVGVLFAKFVPVLYGVLLLSVSLANLKGYSHEITMNTFIVSFTMLVVIQEIWFRYFLMEKFYNYCKGDRKRGKRTNRTKM